MSEAKFGGDPDHSVRNFRLCRWANRRRCRPRDVERIVDVVKAGLQGRVQQHTGQILDMPVLQERFREDYGTGGQYFLTTIWEHIVEVPKSSSQDRILQRTVEQVLDVPVQPMIEEVVEVPKIVYQNRIPAAQFAFGRNSSRGQASKQRSTTTRRAGNFCKSNNNQNRKNSSDRRQQFLTVLTKKGDAKEEKEDEVAMVVMDASRGICRTFQIFFKVNPRHMSWWHKFWCIRAEKQTTFADGARPSTTVASSHHGRAGDACLRSE